MTSCPGCARAGTDGGSVSCRFYNLNLSLDVKKMSGRTIYPLQVRGADLGIVVVPEANAAAALEVVSRHAVDPRWPIHLPPTMSPVETSPIDGWLERPEETFAYYATKGVTSVVVEEKHMGSRALVVLARTQAVAERRFGIADGSRGVVTTRTGRRFFTDPEIEAAVLHRLDTAMASSGL